MTLTGQIKASATRLWHAQEVKRLVRDALGADRVTMVSAQELDCTGPTCAAASTWGIVYSPDLTRRTLVIHVPLRDVAKQDLDMRTS